MTSSLDSGAYTPQSTPATAYVPPWRAGSRSHATIMCATPGQTGSSWERTLRETVLLGVGHISVYPLMIEEGRPFPCGWVGGSPAWNDEDVEAARMLPGAGSSSRVPASFAMRSASYARRRGPAGTTSPTWTGGNLPWPGNISLQYAFG